MEKLKKRLDIKTFLEKISTEQACVYLTKLQDSEIDNWMKSRTQTLSTSKDMDYSSLVNLDRQSIKRPGPAHFRSMQTGKRIKMECYNPPVFKSSFNPEKYGLISPTSFTHIYPITPPSTPLAHDILIEDNNANNNKIGTIRVKTLSELGIEKPSDDYIIVNGYGKVSAKFLYSLYVKYFVQNKEPQKYILLILNLLNKLRANSIKYKEDINALNIAKQFNQLKIKERYDNFHKLRKTYEMKLGHLFKNNILPFIGKDNFNISFTIFMALIISKYIGCERRSGQFPQFTMLSAFLSNSLKNSGFVDNSVIDIFNNKTIFRDSCASLIQIMQNFKKKDIVSTDLSNQKTMNDVSNSNESIPKLKTFGTNQNIKNITKEDINVNQIKRISVDKKSNTRVIIEVLPESQNKQSITTIPESYKNGGIIPLGHVGKINPCKKEENSFNKNFTSNPICVNTSNIRSSLTRLTNSGALTIIPICKTTIPDTQYKKFKNNMRNTELLHKQNKVSIITSSCRNPVHKIPNHHTKNRQPQEVGQFSVPVDHCKELKHISAKNNVKIQTLEAIKYSENTTINIQPQGTIPEGSKLDVPTGKTNTVVKAANSNNTYKKITHISQHKQPLLSTNTAQKSDLQLSEKYQNLLEENNRNQVAKKCDRKMCINEATLKCGGCNEVYYCSNECQANDWEETHNKVCLYIYI